MRKINKIYKERFLDKNLKDRYFKETNRYLIEDVIKVLYDKINFHSLDLINKNINYSNFSCYASKYEVTIGLYYMKRYKYSIVYFFNSKNEKVKNICYYFNYKINTYIDESGIEITEDEYNSIIGEEFYDF